MQSLTFRGAMGSCEPERFGAGSLESKLGASDLKLGRLIPAKMFSLCACVSQAGLKEAEHQQSLETGPESLKRDRDSPGRWLSCTACTPPSKGEGRCVQRKEKPGRDERETSEKE